MSDLNQPSSGRSSAVPVLIGGLVALVGANIYLYTQLEGVRSDFTQFRTAMQTEVQGLKDNSTVSTQTARRSLTGLKDELETARRQAQMAVGQAKIEAQKHQEELARRVAAEQARIEQQAQQMKTDLTASLTEVEKTATSKITEVSTEVGAVKTEVASTRSELEKTASELRRVRGDLDGTASVVATNGQELATLRALGERNFFEFDLRKAKEPRRVGDVAVVLKKADAKRNRFTIEIIADDKRVEKKDKNLNEPVQFYVSKARQPYEIVVNEVKKDQIVGYLSTPKVQTSRN